MKDLYWLSQIQYAEQSLVGNEFFILSQLLQRECPILPGFVLGNNLWREFLSLTKDQLLIPVDGEDYQSRQTWAIHGRQVVQQTNIPQRWQREWFQAAQQLDSHCLILEPFVNSFDGIQPTISSSWRSHTCNCTPEALTIALKSVWSEFFNASSLVYWQKLGLDYDRINLSVLVRPLKNAEASGTIVITDDWIHITANWGLSQSLLWGDVEPDCYYLERDLGQILSQSLGHKNYAYRERRVSLSSPVNDCLEAYLPPEHLAATYVLNQEEIFQLFQLTQDILRQQPQIKSLVWTAFKSPTSSTPAFYFTRLSDRPRSDTVADENLPHSSLSSVSPLLSGLPVSSGTIQAEIAVIPDLNTLSQAVPPGTILVTKVIEPQYIPLLKQIKGLITEIGGKNSHAAIVAREMRIPAIANANDATKILHHGDRILLNGDDGHIYPATSVQPRRSRPAMTNILSPTYPIATKLMVNLSQLNSIAMTSNLPIDGVGLLRSELMLADLLSSQVLAKWQESFKRQFVANLSNCLRQFGAAFAPRPVFYRSLDLYSNSSNSILGNRGTYHYLADPALFDLELEALQKIIEEGYGNVNLMLPFVRSVDEFKFCYRRLENVGLTVQDSFQVWMMAEVPSVIMLLPEYIQAGVQGVAIGTNDLTQLLLGVDREQTQFSDRGLNANHPAMQRAIAKLIKTAHEHQIECCICGQAPVEHPELIDLLVQWGIDTISVEPNAVAQTYKAIARAEKRMLLGEVRNNDQ